MKTIPMILILIAILFPCTEGHAVPITMFQDTDTFVSRAQDILIARCVSVPKGGDAYDDGLYPLEVDVLMVLKGDKKSGRMKIATIYPMEQGTTYLLASLGGSAFGTDFLALPELSVLPVPETFDLKTLAGKSTKEQIQRIFARHLYEVEQKLAPLLKTQSLLEQGLSDRTDDLYQSPGVLPITTVHEATTEQQHGPMN